MEKSYSDKLKDPRWQQKRLRVMERDKFTCKKCFDTESTLTVHHKYYIYKADPWDYPDEILVTLCDKCHNEEEEVKYIIGDFTKVLLAEGYFATELVQLLDLLRNLPTDDSGLSYIHGAIKEYNEDMNFMLPENYGKGSSSIILHK